MEDKDLLRQHLLFKRLSGQIVWYLFEERHVASEEIDAFFTYLEACRVETLDAMRRLLHPSSDANEVFLLVEIRPGTEDAPPCARCGRMNGLLIPADHPDILAYMPPYGLGCRARARVLSRLEAEPYFSTQPETLPDPPGHELHCPTEWIFRHNWSGNALDDDAQ